MRKALAIALLVASGALAQSTIPNSTGRKGTTAIRNATIVPVSGPSIPNGTIVFANGVITAIGASATVPADANVIDGTGLFVYPGMIDSGTNVGLVEMDSVPGTVDTAELGDFNPNAQAAVAINPHSEVIPVTRVNGVVSPSPKLRTCGERKPSPKLATAPSPGSKPTSIEARLESCAPRAFRTWPSPVLPDSSVRYDKASARIPPRNVRLTRGSSVTSTYPAAFVARRFASMPGLATSSVTCPVSDDKRCCD